MFRTAGSYWRFILSSIKGALESRFAGLRSGAPSLIENKEKNQASEEAERAQSAQIVLGGATFELWYEAKDSYLSSREAREARSAEANAFRNVCVQLVGGLGVGGTVCIDVGANVGVTSLVLGSLAHGKRTKTPIERVIAFEPEPFTFKMLQ